MNKKHVVKGELLRKLTGTKLEPQQREFYSQMSIVLNQTYRTTMKLCYSHFYHEKVIFEMVENKIDYIKPSTFLAKSNLADF